MFKTILASLVLGLLLVAPVGAITENKDGSITLSKQEVEQLQNEVNGMLKHAYKIGVEDGQEAVKSNPKLCPKDT